MVLESGWSEPDDRFKLDAALWQKGSEGAVRVVLQVIFFKREAGRIGTRMRISRATPTDKSFNISHEEYVKLFYILILLNMLLMNKFNH